MHECITYVANVDNEKHRKRYSRISHVGSLIALINLSDDLQENLQAGISDMSSVSNLC